ncbi:testin-like isoform X2 [Halichondria panicea]|uniref:testin-like isoform X2 n=1 Tax=Halichondria panicea TaxID=6063 RepID=UPI00312BA301
MASDEGKKNKIKRLASVRAVAIQKGVLTHEVDEGSPCLRCGDSCPGFSLHFWRKICKNCLCPREEHDINEDTSKTELQETQVGKILFSPSADTLTRKVSGDAGGRSPRPRRSLEASGQVDSPSLLKKSHNFIWTPSGCSVAAARAYFEGLPQNKAPVRGTPGERYRQKQLIRQLPAYDIDTLYCNDLEDEERKQMELFVRVRREKALGRGEVKLREQGDRSPLWVCSDCKLPMRTGEVGVFADRAGVNKCWHPACFTCCDCNEILVDLIYFYHNEDKRIYCGRHHAERLKPRCAACDELILCTEYTRAEDSDWHLDHFCCLRCDKELGGKQYRPQDGMPFCLSCYEISFATVCESCGKTITLDEPRLCHGNYTWHGTPKCFRCAVCHDSLVDKAFLPKHGKVFCSKSHAKQYRSKN